MRGDFRSHRRRGLAGLTAARELRTKGAAVTVIDARDRVGGRVLTVREPFLHGEHAEAGADLIDESQTEICRLIASVGLRTAKILPGGFTSVRQIGRQRRPGGKRAWEDLGKRLQPEIRAFCVSEQRWDGGVAASLARESVAQWLDRIRAPKALREVAIGLRGFFLADPSELSLLALADQFAEEGAPGREKMFRIAGGNDRLPAVLAKALGSRLRLQTILRRVTQTRHGVTAALESNGRVQEARFDYLVCAMPATTVRDVVFEPGLPDLQREAVHGRQVRRGYEDRSAVRSRAVAKARTSLERSARRSRLAPCGMATRNSAGRILTLLAGGGASAATREMLAAEGPSRHRPRALVAQPAAQPDCVAWTTLSWEHEPWSRGGYAFFDQQFPPPLRYWLARPFDRVFFAGEHTSLRWQGYMNGAVESGLRAAEEVTSIHNTHHGTTSE